MNGGDDEFDDFLRRRRPMFGRDDGLEPPAELDRVVLRQAREAIEAEKPPRVFRAPYWSMPVALAATLVLAFTIILRVGSPAPPAKSEVTVQNVSRQIEYPAAPAPPPAEAVPVGTEAASDGMFVVDLAASSADAQSAPARTDTRERRLEKVADAAQPRAATPTFASEEEANRYAQPAGGASGRTAANDPYPGAVINGERAEVSSTGELKREPAAAAKAGTPVPEWRRDSKTWLAEIERLRASGDVARADAEQAEYKRQHRAYAVAPDR